MKMSQCGLSEAERRIFVSPLDFVVILLVVAAWLPPAQAAYGPFPPAKLLDAPEIPATAGEELSGRVLDPQGRPVAGARVALLQDMTPMSARIDNGILEWMGDGEEERHFVSTDGEGRFLLGAKPSDSFDLIAAQEAGFALAAGGEFRESHEIRLQEWGRVEGQLANGRGRPGCGIRMLGLPNPTWLGHMRDLRYDTRCDAQGHFVFERVPPGWFEVGYVITMGDDRGGFTSRTPVAVQAGETAQVQLGGEGRPVIGRFVPPTSYGKPVHFGVGVRELRTHWPYPIGADKEVEWDQELTRQEAQARKERPESSDVNWPEPPLYRNRDNPSAIKSMQRTRYYRRLFPEPVGGGYSADAIWEQLRWRGYAFRIKPDGSFRIEDVVPGWYDLRIGLELEGTHEPFSGVFAGYGGVIEVPSAMEPSPSQPFDLGDLPLDMLGVGEVAPPFEGRTLDGKPIRLVDYRGKFVLLSFSSDIEVDVNLNSLKELHKTYGERGNLQIIGFLSGGKDKVDLYVAQHRIEWPVICEGEDGCTGGIAQQYQLGGYPNAVLVDTEGKIIASELRGEELVNAVRDALRPGEEGGQSPR